MKKIPLIILLVITTLISRAQTTVHIVANIASGCSFTTKLLAYLPSGTGCTFFIASNPIVLTAGSGGAGGTYTTTSPIWPVTLPGSAQIKGAIVTPSPCSTTYTVGDACTGYASSAWMICGSCYKFNNNCRWSVAAGDAELTITQ